MYLLDDEATPEQLLAFAVLQQAIEQYTAKPTRELQQFFCSRRCIGWLTVLAPDSDAEQLQEQLLGRLQLERGEHGERHHDQVPTLRPSRRPLRPVRRPVRRLLEPG